MRPAQRLAQAEREVSAFNANHTVGTPVRYWRGLREGEGSVSKTRSEAYVLSGHTAVVMIEGTSGCIGLTHVEAS